MKKKKKTKKVAETIIDDVEKIEDISTTHDHEHKTKAQVRDEKEILMDEGLQAIYGNGKIDFNKFDQRQNKLTRTLLVTTVVLAIIAATSWAGFFVYTRFFEVSHDKTFDLSINIPEQIASGEKTQIEILYANPTNVPIAALQMDINLPATFRTYSFSQDPTNLDDLIWELGSLPGMSDGKIVIDGVWIAQVPSETPVQVHASYKPANFNSNFEEIAIAYVTTIEGTLKAIINGSEEASAGQDIEYTISVENTGQEAFENIIAGVDLPDGFYLQESDPALESGGPAEWLIERIDPQGKQEIKFSGTFASNIENFQYFNLSVKIKSADRELEQATAQAYTDVVASNVTIGLVANGSTTSANVDLSSSLRLSIGLENSEDRQIEDLTVLLDFQSDDSIPITWNKSSLDGGTITRDGIHWSFDSIEPGEKITINTSFPIDSTIGVGDADTFRVVASTDYEGHSALSSPIDVSINSQAELQTSIRYYDENGSALGNGPLPPQVGNTTTYRVIWTINNSLHDLKNITVNATLPPHVSWAGNVEQDLGAIIYNDSAKSVTWSVSSLSSSVEQIQGSFSISITPDTGDIGSFVKLISASSLIANDALTDTALSRATDSLTTDLQDDAQASRVGGIAVE
ncbi:hypothetical protein KJ673_00430 [Patescibacteria group bacterium]|nr:hypothetical protein [Patescibacteria group bacterium]MCG2688001.1 hypothetical protein [Candidatus Parcubacteria bacterium]